MNIKKIFLSKVSASLSLLLFLTGCQATNSSLESLAAPKKKVPPYEEVKQGEDELEEEIIAPFEAKKGPVAQPEENEPPPQLDFPPRQPSVARQMSLPPLPDRRYLSERIAFYKKRKEQWQALSASFSSLDLIMPEASRWTECMFLISETQKDYLSLQEKLGHSFISQDDQSLFEVFQQDISFLESDCERVFASAAAVIPDELQKYKEIVAGQADGVVKHWATLGDNGKIISSYENLLVATGGKTISSGTREVYGKALRAEGRLAEAAAILLEVAEAQGDFAGGRLRLEAAEILFAQGDFKRAQEQYEKLADLIESIQQLDLQVKQHLALLQGQAEHGRELELFSRALAGWFRFDGKTIPPALARSVLSLENNFPESDYTRLARQLFDEAGGTVQTYVEQEIKRVRELAAQKKFTLAEEILNTLSQSTDSEALLLVVKEAQDEVKILHEEEREREERRRVQELKSKWQEALRMFDQRQYDAAIVRFQELINSEYRDQARAKMMEATNLAASELRKESAGLFVQSKKVEHPEQKGALLLESRRLLLLIQEKYPDADVINKVKQNIGAIEKQIRILDASLLER